MLAAAAYLLLDGREKSGTQETAQVKEVPPAPATLETPPAAPPETTPPVVKAPVLAADVAAPLTMSAPLPPSRAAPPRRRPAVAVKKTPRPPVSSAAVRRAPESVPPVVQTIEVAPAPQQQAQAPGPAIESSPRAACAGRVFLGLSMCMSDQCSTVDFYHHPECLRIRDRDRQIQERLDQGG